MSSRDTKPTKPKPKPAVAAAVSLLEPGPHERQLFRGEVPVCETPCVVTVYVNEEREGRAQALRVAVRVKGSGTEYETHIVVSIAQAAMLSDLLCDPTFSVPVDDALGVWVAHHMLFAGPTDAPHGIVMDGRPASPGPVPVRTPTQLPTRSDEGEWQVSRSEGGGWV
jgi:hypothetical protein